MAEIHDLTAVQQAAAVRRRELSPVEITEHYLDRVARLDRKVGAFITVAADSARAQARAAEREALSATPGEPPPLLGVPVPVKDLEPVAGLRHTSGSAVHADRVADADCDVVAELRAAGAVFTGKTNTPEFGLPCHTENDIAPPARTPWDPTRSAGGSSGGAAAAVAAGFAPVAHASDGGGSIRIPASACGLFGLKPTRGRVTSGPFKPDFIGLSTAGPIARTVADAALILDIVSVNRPGDYYTAPPLPAGETFLGYALRDPGRLRIARYDTAPVPGLRLDPEVTAAYEAATKLLIDLGHDVEDIDPPYGADTVEDFNLVWAAMAAATPVRPEDEHLLRPLTRWLRGRAADSSVGAYMAATARIQGAVRAALPRTLPYDAVLTPTLALPPVPVGHFGTDPEEEFRRMTAFTPFTALANITGQPSVSVPLHWSAEGLPIGTMLTGRPGGEPTLLALSAQLEAARPWAGHRPPVWAE
ncbi:amidase [Streptomonospora sp. S1-112]|uniref:Amidase n=1 Tax=Streptomonospora mangrovi TaxID=2883123 RepID=A0A9X3NKD6_9ACTN|nr:amidase [Streptomonospora mangrovi]MDA0564908.1 amidase [Streptomonospora mangrovi]